MMQFGMRARLGGWMVCVAVSALALSACSKKDASADTTAQPASAPASADTTSTETAIADNSAAPAAPAAKAPAADNTDTISGVKLASYTGDADKGKVDFLTCQTCHSIAAGENKIGPSLHGVVGRPAGSIPGFQYSTANKTSGITWTPEKLFQYLENPQRVVPGTKMTFAGFPEPQKRADVIAYLKTNS